MNNPYPEKANKPHWIFERSSGYAGWRCTVCYTWVYANKPLVLKCNCGEVKPKKKTV